VLPPSAVVSRTRFPRDAPGNERRALREERETGAAVSFCQDLLAIGFPKAARAERVDSGQVVRSSKPAAPAYADRSGV
jgi:hypothetical protein